MATKVPIAFFLPTRRSVACFSHPLHTVSRRHYLVRAQGQFASAKFTAPRAKNARVSRAATIVRAAAGAEEGTSRRQALIGSAAAVRLCKLDAA